MKRRIVLFGALLTAVGLFRVVNVTAQTDPRQILAGMILQAQMGRPNPLWYGAELWQIIAIQTGYTGYYPQLAQLGPVRNIVVTQQLSLPAGVLYAMTAQHVAGPSYWVFGIGSATNRIEYATFATGPGAAPYTLPGVPSAGPPPSSPAPAPSVGTGTTPSSSGSAEPTPTPPLSGRHPAASRGRTRHRKPARSFRTSAE